MANIEKLTGKSLEELSKIVKTSGLSKHGELVSMLKRDLGMGHGDANTLVHTVRNPARKSAAPNGLDGLYVGPKAAVRPIHEKLLVEISKFGDCEEAPKGSQSHQAPREPASRADVQLQGPAF